MIRFGAPEWLALLPFLLFAAWRWRGLGFGLDRPLRLPCLLLLVLALAEPTLRRGGHGIDVWLLVDRSASARDRIEPRRAEIETLLDRSRGGADRLFTVDYAAAPQLRSAETEAFGYGLTQTRTAAALRFTLAHLDPDREARLLLLTDGFSTEPLSGIGDALARAQVPLDVRLFTGEERRDYRVDELRLPSSLQPGEPFLAEGWISGDTDADVPVAVLRDDVEIAHTTAHVVDGRAAVRFTDRLTAGGAVRYGLRVRAPGDPIPGNDAGYGWTAVGGGRRILLVTGYTDAPLARPLAAQGFDVETVTDPGALTPGRLAGARLLILDNVPSYRLRSDFLAAIDGFVRVQGGGLAMTGGKLSFGSGGYFQSPIDALLPVSMELKQEHRKLAVAMAIVMDRSGSMGAAVGHGLTKMDLANDGAARSLTLLTDHDAAAVIAVDTEPHRVLPLSTLGKERGHAIDIVRRVQSGGGGIYIGTALEAAWEELHAAPQGQRHVVLFADASDSEEPGEYKRLVDRMVRDGITISVIGMGTESDKDADLLKDIARLGRGRIFFTDEPSTIPALFAQETVTVARSAFLTDPVAAHATAGWQQMAGRPLAGLTRVDGYNLSYLRDGATAAVVSGDEYEAPLVAFWQRGAGRAAAVSFPMGGEYSATLRAWPAYGDFAQTIARWLAAADTPPGISLRTRLSGQELGLDLRMSEDAERRTAGTLPTVLLLEGNGEPRELTWEHVAPGRLEARVALTPGPVYRGAVQIGNATLPFGPLEAPGGAEWAMDRTRVQELLAVAHRSGGGEIADLTTAWRRPAARRSTRDLRPPLLLLFLGIFLAESLRSRLAGAGSRPRPATASASAMKDATAATPIATEATAPQAEAKPPETDRLADALRRAKRR
jgi:hypothetical protein